MGPPGWKTKFAGVGLGLQKFAAAKKSTYDKRAVQAKEQALNAKKVNKYRKLLKKLGGAENGESTPVAAGEGANAAEGSQPHRIAKVGAAAAVAAIPFPQNPIGMSLSTWPT